jgi:hypothetical protein
MPSSGNLLQVALVRADVSEESWFLQLPDDVTSQKTAFFKYLLLTSFLSPTLLLIQWVRGGVVSTVIKRPKREADHSPSGSIEVKNTWVTVSTPPYISMA